MTSTPSCRRGSRIARRRAAWHGWRRHECSEGPDERGFTLIELLIVVTILPLVVGGLSYGLLTVLKLQTGVANKIADTGDSQVVLANFTSDVQAATYITTQSGTTSQCGAGTQILGLEWGQSPSSPYNFENVVSYVEIQYSGSSNYSLVRQYCTTTASGAAISSSTTSTVNNGAVLASSVILSNNYPFGTTPTIAPTNVGTSASTSWVPASTVSSVTLTVTESATPTQALTSDSYSYSLVGTPQSTSSATATGTPDVTSNNTSCGFATAGTGPYANNLCFVDFSLLTGARLTAADGYNTNNSGVITNCGLEMSATLPGNYTMYFCIGISGTTDPVTNEPDVAATTVPIFGQAALGNDIYTAAYPYTGGLTYPFYIGIPGNPALDQYLDQANNDTVTFSNISVVNQEGVAATGWKWITADAEATGTAESITWSSNAAISSLPNGFPWDTGTGYGGTDNSLIGDACYGGLVTTNNLPTSESMKCVGQNPPTPSPAPYTYFTGAAMIYGSGSEVQATLVSAAGEEGITFGVFTAGEGAR